MNDNILTQEITVEAEENASETTDLQELLAKAHNLAAIMKRL